MRKFTHSIIALVGTVILLLVAIIPSSLIIVGNRSQYEVNAESSVSTVDLANINILKETQLFSKNGTSVSDGVKLEKKEDSTYDLDLLFKGTAVADVGLVSPKIIVFAIPEELKSKIVGPIKININAKLMPIVPGDVPGVKDLVLNVGGLVTKLLGLAKPLGLQLDSLEKAFEGLNSLQDLGSYHATVEGKLSPDGNYVMVDFTDGLGEYVRAAYANLFNPLEEAVDGLKFTGLLAILNPTLDLLKPAVNDLLELVGKIADGTSDVLTNALQANVLGNVDVDFSTTVFDVTAEKAQVTVMAVNDPVIDLELLNTIYANGDSINLYFDKAAENPLANYPVISPIVEDIIEGMTDVKGRVALSQPIPEGTTFNAKVELPDGSILTNNINEDGSFAVPFGKYQPQGNDQLKIVIEAQVGSYSKVSEPTIKQVIADPFLKYPIAKPIVEDILEEATSLKGSVTLTEPLLVGVTFKVKVQLPDGAYLTGTISQSGTFVILFDKYQPIGNDQLKITIEASDGKRTKSSEPEIKQVVVNPLNNYQVPKPQFKTVNEGSKAITGTIPLVNVPVGTNLFMQVRFPDGSVRKVALEKDGTFSIPIVDKNLKEGNPLRLVTIAEHTQSLKGKESDNVVFAVGRIPSLEGYIVPTPVVSPIFVGDTMIKGSVKITSPPEGTQFKVRVRFPGSIYEETLVNADGTFSLDISGRQLAAGTSITLNTTATLGTEAAASGRVIVSVGAK